MQIASHLGIGLIQVRRGKCTEVLSSPFYEPIENLNLRLLEVLGLGKCQLCASVFKLGVSAKNRFGRLSRENLARAIDLERGLMFWNREVAERKNKLGLRVTKDGSTNERRFLCPDCIGYVFAQLQPVK